MLMVIEGRPRRYTYRVLDILRSPSYACTTNRSLGRLWGAKAAHHAAENAGQRARAQLAGVGGCRRDDVIGEEWRRALRNGLPAPAALLARNMVSMITPSTATQECWLTSA